MKSIPLEIRYPIGAACTVNGNGDLFMCSEARQVIRERCEVLQVTKSGNVVVRRVDGQGPTCSVPPGNVDLEHSAAWKKIGALLEGISADNPMSWSEIACRIAELDREGAPPSMLWLGCKAFASARAERPR